MPDVKQAQQRYQQFIQLLPLTMGIAGLPQSEIGKYFNEDQMDVRTQMIKKAYNQARKLARDVLQQE